MKFTKNPNVLCDKIVMGEGGGKNDLSRYQGKKLILPNEQIADTKKYCINEAQNLKNQAKAIQHDNPELAKKKIEQAKHFEELASNIEGAGFTSEQARAYRLNPVKETAKSIGMTAHEAGIQGAQYGAVIGGSISIVTNTFAVYQGDKKIGEALIDCSKSTLKAATVGYATATTGAVIKGTMEQAYGVLQQQAINKATKDLSGKAVKKATEKAVEEFAKSTTGKLAQGANALSKTSLPALAVTVCLEFGGLVKQYASGEIDGVEFMERAGEKGIGISASTVMAAIGQVAIPIPVVGAVIGGTIGYTLSSMFYNEALTAFKGAKQAHENYLLLEARYQEAKKLRDFYQAELKKQFDEHMAEQKAIIADSFENIDLAISTGNMDNFIQSINFMGEKLFNKDLKFKSQAEFDDFMLSAESFKL